MKKILGLALLATVFTTSAFASVARLEALGEDQYGSQYINDNRNMFLNAAAVNDHFDFVTFEWGDTTKVVNSESTPKAQGGIFRKSGEIVYGVYFGADSNTASELRVGGLQHLYRSGAFGTPTTTTTNGLAEGRISQLASQIQNQNTLDLFVGGETSFKWGARLSYTTSNNDQGYQGSNLNESPVVAGVSIDEVEQSGILLGLGSVFGVNEIYANIGLGNDVKLNNITNTGLAVGAANSIEGEDFHFKGQIGYQLGYIRSLGNGTKAWLEYQQQDAKEEKIAALDGTQEVQRLSLGWGKTSKLNDTFSAFYKALYTQSSVESFGFVKSNEDVEASVLRATLGFEVLLKEWLVLRASIANNVVGETTLTDRGASSKDSRSIGDSTDVRLGATLAFGDFGIDGLIGNDANGDGTAGDDNGQIRTDSLMSRVSMTYKF
jgi:hypothetical protein